MTTLQFVLIVLASWRVAHILLRENGPWGLFRRVRVALGVLYASDEDHTVVAFRYEITVCMWCLSVWVGVFATAFVAIALWLPNRTWEAGWGLLLPFAISAGVVVIDHVVEWLKK